MIEFEFKLPQEFIVIWIMIDDDGLIYLILIYLEHELLYDFHFLQRQIELVVAQRLSEFESGPMVIIFD